VKKPKPQAPTTPRITPSGARRAGDNYQDARAAKFLVEWLNEPHKYRYVILENDDAGSLDDITAQTQKGQWILVQVKYTTDAEAKPLTFSDLLVKFSSKTGRTRSLLEKWSDSLRAYSPDQILLATVETNRRAGDDLQKCLDNGHVDLTRVESTIRQEILDQLGEERAVELFGTLVFQVNLPNIDETEEYGRGLLSMLNPQRPDAWDNLMKAIKDWIVSPSSLPDGPRIGLADVQMAARWHVLREINERFHVPSDTIVPDDSVFSSMLTELDAGSRVLEVTGAPGSGKSTLLSMFAESMKSQGDVVLRHHYFISLTDETERRYSAGVTIESLMRQIKEYGADLLGGEEDRRSPDPHEPGELGSWLRSCAGKMKEQQRRLIVIIDGLDNAYSESRQNAQEELENVFEILLPPPDGMYVIIGSQVIREEELPNALVRRAHDRKVVRIPPLRIDAVDSWLEEHGTTSMNVDPKVLERDEQRHKMAGAIIEASGGLPLAFRLLQHQAMASGSPVDECSISNLPKVIDGDIEEYYSSLWVRVGLVSRAILTLLVQFPWLWPVSGIRQCMMRGGYTSGDVDQAVREIRHLLSQEPGPVTVFHTSLAWFVADQAEFGTWKPRLTPTVVSWLRDEAPETYRRAHLWIVQASVEDTAELVSQPERSWLVDSLRHHLPRRYISQILTASGRCALKQGRFDLFARRSVLQDYVSDVFDYDGNGKEALGILLPGQLVRYASQGLAEQLEGEIRSLSDMEIHALFEYFQETKDALGARRCLEEIEERTAQHGSDDVQFHELSERLAYYADMLTCMPDVSADKLVDWIRRNRKAGSSAAVAVNCAKGILKHKRVALAHEFLTHAAELEPKEIRGCFPWLYALLIEQHTCLASDISSEIIVASGPWPHLLLMSQEKDRSKIPSIELPDIREVFVPDEPTSWGESDRVRRIVDLFFSFFVNYGTGREDTIRDWCDRKSSTEWIFSFVHLLAEAARRLFQQTVAGSDQETAPLYAGFVGLDPFPKDEMHEYTFAGADCRKALADIMLLSPCLNPLGGKRYLQAETEAALPSRWFIPGHFVRSVVDFNRGQTWSDVADAICQSLLKNLRVEKEEGFMGCATTLAICSEFARQAGTEWMKLADLSCDYLIAYGNHKDIFMFDLLECAEELGIRAPDTARRILSRVSGPALSVLSFTDGRETHDLPNALASTMVSVWPDRILPYYNWLQDHERYREAAHAFADWLRSSAFDTSWDRALSLTSSDSESILELQKRSENSPEAQSVLAAVEKKFGGVEGIARSTESESPVSETRMVEKAPDPSAYPPDRLGDFLLDGRSSAWEQDLTAGWLRFWIEKGRGQEAVDSLEKLHRRDWRRAGAGIETYVQVRSVVGNDAAFVWLVRANQGIRGWLSFYWDASKSETLWREVKRQFPENWLRFIVETVYDEARNENIGTRGMLARLTRYLVFQGQTSAARDLADGASVLLGELVPAGLGIELLQSEWLEQL